MSIRFEEKKRESIFNINTIYEDSITQKENREMQTNEVYVTPIGVSTADVNNSVLLSLKRKTEWSEWKERVIQLIAMGNSLSDIAQRLSTADRTVNKSEAKLGLDYLRLHTLFEMDTKYEVDAEIYNEDFPREQLTHAIDGKRLKKLSEARRNHSDVSVPTKDGKQLLIMMITNIKTGKCYWEVHNNVGGENKQRVSTLIENGMSIVGKPTAILTDRVIGWVIKGLEEMGITPVCYGKRANKQLKQTKYFPYNTEIEHVFGYSIGKWEKVMAKQLNKIDFEDVKEFVDAKLEQRINGNTIRLEMIEQKIWGQIRYIKEIEVIPQQKKAVKGIVEDE